MTATWPATLPPPLIDGYAGGFGVPMTEVDLGVGWARPRVDAAQLARTAEFSLVLTGAQMAALDAFVRDHSPEWFAIALRVADDSAATVSVLARLTADPTPVRLPGGHWRVGLAVEIAPA